MISISVNGGTVSGLVLLISWFFAVPASALQVWTLLNKRADPTTEVVRAAFAKGSFAMLRLIGMPIASLVLFFKGWRLGGGLDLAVLVVSMGWVAEIVVSASADYSAMKRR